MSVQLYALQDIGLEELYKELCTLEEKEEEPVYIYLAKSPPKSKKDSIWNKSRGHPDSSRLAQTMTRESSFNFSLEEDDLSSNCTPYRLPRLSPGTEDLTPNSDADNVQPEDVKSANDDKVWSRYGYEKIIRIPELGPQVRMLKPPPAKSYHGSPFPQSGPRFKNAAITPTVRSVPWTLTRETNDSHLQLYQSNHARVHEDEYSSRHTRLEPTPTPISRSDSPAKSVKSIHWILGHNRYHTFDKKGRSHIQGPYSREFNVTCMAPQNWLKMKWGRSKTLIH